MPAAQRMFMPKSALRAQNGGAVSHDALLKQVGLEVRAFPSEKNECIHPVPPPVYLCDECGRKFSTAQGLCLHKKHKHVAPGQASFSATAAVPRPTFHGKIGIKLAMAGSHVCVSLSVNNKSAEAIAAEVEEDARATAEARAARQAEAHRRRQAAAGARLTGELENLQRRGSAHRHQYTPYEKVRLIELLDEINSDEAIRNKGEAFTEDARSRGAPYTTVIKWLKPDERRAIYRASSQMHAKQLLRIDKTSRQKGRYALMEKQLYNRFKERRAHARKTSARWIVHTARHLVKTLHTEAASTDKPFKAGPGWLRRFARRWRICRRKKTNCKNTTWEETRPVLQRFFRTFRRRLRSDGWRPQPAGGSSSEADAAAASAQKWGKYPPMFRLNVDQVPMPFINDMDYTYEQKGATRVAINQLGPALSKRQCMAQVCFRPVAPDPPPATAPEDARAMFHQHVAPQPAPCIVFRGTGKQISQAEKDAYPSELVVLWQPKAWVDRLVARDWVSKIIKPLVEADRKAGVANENSRYLLIQDNLDAQCQPEYLEMLRNLGVDDHKVPPNKTDQVQPIDRGFGRLLKVYIGQVRPACVATDVPVYSLPHIMLAVVFRPILPICSHT
jgi:hypothetical protein